ncbi:MAG TPA: hypothetical protein VF796_13925 [Humisphaera sp.]
MTTPATPPTARQLRPRLAVLAAVAIGAAATVAALPAAAPAQPDGGPPQPPTVAPAPTIAPAPSGDPLPVSDEEWRQVHDFMAEHSPQKWKAMGRQQRERLKPAIVARYRNLQTVKPDTMRYRSELDALRYEDDIYGLLVQLRAGKPVEPALRAKVGQLVDNRMAWRRERMFRSLRELKSLEAHDAAKALEVEIAKETKASSAQRESRVERRMGELLKQVDGKNLKPRIPPGGRGGPPHTGPAETPGGDGPASD